MSSVRLTRVLGKREFRYLFLGVTSSRIGDAVALAAAPDGAFFPISRTVQQRIVPAAVAGRVQGARGALGAAGFPLGSAAGGLCVAGIGTGPTVPVLAAGYLASALAVRAAPESTVDPAAPHSRAPAQSATSTNP